MTDQPTPIPIRRVSRIARLGFIAALAGATLCAGFDLFFPTSGLTAAIAAWGVAALAWEAAHRWAFAAAEWQKVATLAQEALQRHGVALHVPTEVLQRIPPGGTAIIEIRRPLDGPPRYDA